MNKVELAIQVNKKIGFSVVDLGDIIDAIFEEIGNAIALKEKVTIMNFGVFKPSQHTGHNTRNPHTGIEVNTPPFVRPWFKASRTLKNKVKAGNN